MKEKHIRDNWKNIEIDKQVALEVGDIVYDFFKTPKVRDFMSKTISKTIQGGEEYEEN